MGSYPTKEPGQFHELSSHRFSFLQWVSIVILLFTLSLVGLTESRAINRYIATNNKEKGTDLLRLDHLKESAMVDVWLEVEAHNYNTAISGIVYQLIISPMLGKPIDEQLVAANVEKLERVLDAYEDRLSKSKYLAGDFYGLADHHRIPYTYNLMKNPKLLSSSRPPHVKAWWDDISSRPASKKTAEGMTLARAASFAEILVWLSVMK